MIYIALLFPEWLQPLHFYVKSTATTEFNRKNAKGTGFSAEPSYFHSFSPVSGEGKLGHGAVALKSLECDHSSPECLKPERLNTIPALGVAHLP